MGWGGSWLVLHILIACHHQAVSHPVGLVGKRAGAHIRFCRLLPLSSTNPILAPLPPHARAHAREYTDSFHRILVQALAPRTPPTAGTAAQPLYNPHLATTPYPAPHSLFLFPSHAGSGPEDTTDSVRLLDDQTFEALDRFPLAACELACSISAVTFAGDPTPYYVVGTAIAVPDEPEPTKVRDVCACVYGGDGGGGSTFVSVL